MTTPRAGITPVFVDTGAYYAFGVSEDPNYTEAVRLFRALATGRFQLVTTHLIVSETHTLIRSRLRHRGRSYALAVARDAVADIVASSVAIEAIMPEDGREAVATLFAFPDQVLSYTGAISFALMCRLHIPYVLTFDEDFAAAGFTNVRHILP